MTTHARCQVASLTGCMHVLGYDIVIKTQLRTLHVHIIAITCMNVDAMVV